MAEVDLTRPAQVAAGKVLVDVVNVWADPEGSTDDAYDPGTLEYGPSSGDLTKVHDALPAKLKHQLRQGLSEEAGAAVTVSEYVVSVPMDTPVGARATVFMAGDWVEVVSSKHDPGLAGRWLRVVEEAHGTMKVFRQARARMKEHPPQ